MGLEADFLAMAQIPTRIRLPADLVSWLDCFIADGSASSSALRSVLASGDSKLSPPCAESRRRPSPIPQKAKDNSKVTNNQLQRGCRSGK